MCAALIFENISSTHFPHSLQPNVGFNMLRTCGRLLSHSSLDKRQAVSLGRKETSAEYRANLTLQNESERVDTSDEWTRPADKISLEVA